MSTNHRKTAYSLRKNVEAFCTLFGIENVGFLTLTFRDHVLDARKAQERFHSLATHVLNVRYGACWVRVLERQESGRIHYHLLVRVGKDIRTGLDFEAIGRGCYLSANAYLRAEWAYWRVTAPKYRFGRTELLPVRSCTEAISDYVGKYIAKHIGNREERDKGVRLVSYGRNCPSLSSVKFAWHSGGATAWRRKLAWFSRSMGYTAANWQECMVRDFGSRWSFHLTQWICAVKFLVYATYEEYSVDWPDRCSEEMEGSVDIRMAGGEVERIVSETQARCLFVAMNLRVSRARKENPCNLTRVCVELAEDEAEIAGGAIPREAG